ncbi:MAG: hypothetical protein ACR2MP_27270 [Streptosporangiaceae bacterium]
MARGPSRCVLLDAVAALIRALVHQAPARQGGPLIIPLVVSHIGVVPQPAGGLHRPGIAGTMRG